MLKNIRKRVLRTGVLLLVASAFFGLLFYRPVQAAINQQINFQGKLTNTDGTNVSNGTYSIVFSIYSVASGGSAIWTETQGSVSITDGIFRVALGSSTALPGSVDFNSNSLYLGVKVGADAEMSPRVQFTAAPYAFNADKVGGVAVTSLGQLASNQTWTGTNIFQPTTNITSAIIKQTSAASPTADIFNVQTANATSVFQVTGPVANEAAVTLNSVGATRDLTLDSGSAKIVLGTNTTSLQKSGTAFTFDVANGSNSTFTITNSGAGTASLSVEGGVSIGSGQTYKINGTQISSSALSNDANLAKLDATQIFTGVNTFQTDSATALTVKDQAGATTVLSVDTLTHTVGITGGLTINTNDSNIVRSSSADFSSGTVGSSLTNTNGQLEMSDGTIPNSSKGTITTAGQPTTSGAIGAGALGIRRPDGKTLVIRGGGTGMDIYDDIAGTFTNSAQTLNGNAGAGSLAFPRTNGGQYRVIHGGGLTTTSLVDPTGTVAVGASVAVNASNAGTVAFRRADGRFIFTNGGAATTQIYNSVADTFAAGPSLTTGTSAAGSLFLPRPDGSALLVVGGATSATQIYTPTSGASDIGVFSVGPSLDGAAAAGACGINGTASVGIRRPDGKYLVLSKVNVSALYDPVANTVTCRASGPATALGAGAQAIPLQNGTFLILVGGASTASYIYDPSADTFTSHGTATTAISTGSFSIMRQNGTWQILAGASTTTNNYDTGLPMNGTNTKYTSDDISTTSLNASSLLRWTSQMEHIYASARNGSTNTAYSAIQFFVRTATNSSGCTTPLNAATDKEIANSGDYIRPGPTDSCVRITVQMNRPLPVRVIDDRGVWSNTNTVTALDYASPTLFDVMVDNVTVLHRDNFTYSEPSAQSDNNGTIPTAPTSNAPASVGSCTNGTHYWFATFITNGVESKLSAASTVQTCNGSNAEGLTAVPTGPTGTSARKIYRTKAAAVATDTAFYVGTINDNSTTTYSDTLADGSLGAAYAQTDPSGPILNRVEAINGKLTLPNGRITPLTQGGTTGFYTGAINGAHPAIPQAQTNQGTIVLARPNKTFIVIAALTAPAANAALYDPATQTFTSQTGSSIPTAANGAGGFAVKRPDGKFLVVLGNSSTTTNIYDPGTNVFSAGPALTAAAAVGASAIPNSDGSFTIVHGGGLTSSTLYDPVRNTMSAGPVLTTAGNCGFWAVPLNNGMYKVFPGVANGVVGVTTSMFYNPQSKIFTAGTAMTSVHGCGSFAFQRQDGFWVSVAAGAGTAGADTAVTNIINPDTGTTLAGPNLTGTAGTSTARNGAHVIPRADGSFLIIHGRQVTNTTIYFPWGGTFGVGAGIGTTVAGPTLATAADAGAVSFQRPDGKWIIIVGNATQTVNIYDAGWYGDGQYLSEQVQVPALAANSVMNWTQTNDNFVRMEVKTASTQAGLATASAYSVGRPGQSIGNAGGETWLQIEINFRRDFPTFGGALDGVYRSGGGGGNVYPYRQISQPTVTQYSVNNGSDLLTLQGSGMNAFRVTSQGNIYSSTSGGFYSGGADLAENYTSKETLFAGEVVVSDPATSNQSVKRSSGQYQGSVLGVVSTEPGFVAGAFTENSYPIALAGRVPVKISTENGAVKAGDYLTAASIPGYAMRATVGGRVLGTAMESFDESKATDCPPYALGLAPTTTCGSVMMFVNLMDYQGMKVESLMAEADEGQYIGEAYVPNTTVYDVNGVMSSDESKLLGFISQLKSKQATGQTPTGTDLFINRIVAVNQVTTPEVVADTVKANVIKANKIEGIEVFTDKLSKLSQDVNGLKTQQTITNATPSGVSDVAYTNPQANVDIHKLATLEIEGALTVNGPSLFKGKSTFEALAEFMQDVTINGALTVNGRVTFNRDGGGTAVIPKGAKRVDVLFDKPYSDTPVISATVTALADPNAADPQQDIATKEDAFFQNGYVYLVSNIQKKGFTIVLNKKAEEDVTFNWSAVSIKDAQTTTGAPVPTPSVSQ